MSADAFLQAMMMAQQQQQQKKMQEQMMQGGLSQGMMGQQGGGAMPPMQGQPMQASPMGEVRPTGPTQGQPDPRQLLQALLGPGAGMSPMSPGTTGGLGG